MLQMNLNLMVIFLLIYFLIHLGSLTLHDCDDYCNLDEFNNHLGEYMIKKKAYNLKKNLKHFGKKEGWLDY